MWIECNTEQPEDEGMYLVYDDYYRDIIAMQWNGRNWKTLCRKNTRTKTVTHWFDHYPPPNVDALHS